MPITNTHLRDLPQLLGEQARLRPEHTALIQNDRRISYLGLDLLADRVAAALQADGLRADDTVAVCAAMSVEYLAVLLGTLRAGGVIVPLPTLAHPEQLATMVADCGAAIVFVDRASARIPSTTVRQIVLDAVGVPDAFSEWLLRAAVEPVPVAIAPEMRFAIIYSSGTTGTPKGIVHTHGMRWSGIVAGAALGIDVDTVCLIATPLYSNTTLVTLLPTLALGGAVVLMAKFDSTEFLRLSEHHRVTHSMLVPVQYARILADAEFDAHDLSSYRVKLCTSAPFAADLKAEVLRRWPGGLIEFYGLTEGGGVTMLSAHERLDKLHTVGRPLEGHEFRLIDASGAEVPAGSIGEIVSRAPTAAATYHGRAQDSVASRWIDAQGRPFFRTGDIGRFDAEGFLSIVGRRKDMIVSGGFNIYPQDLERILLQHPAVAEAAVVAAPSARWGETPVAFVVLHPHVQADAEDLRTWANARLGKAQRLAGLSVLTELPRSAVGKVLKTDLRRIAAEDAHSVDTG